MHKTDSSQMLKESQLNALYQYAMVLCQNADDAYDLLQSSVEKYLIEVKCRRQPIVNQEACNQPGCV